MTKDEIYFSIDVESDGPIPGPHSMLSIGCVAFDDSGVELDSFSMNLEGLPDASVHPETAAWWKTQPEAWELARKDTRDPRSVMTAFVRWVDIVCEAKGGKPVAVAYPAGFDWTFVYWYVMKFVGRSPFGFQCLDMKSFAMAKLDGSFKETSKQNMPKSWFEGLPPHTHEAVADAREQGLLFFRMRGRMVT